MDTKSLLIGISSFIAGALLVSVAATTFEKPAPKPPSADSMSAMTESLQSKTGDEYDQVFLSEMIAHHEGALKMAKLSASQAKHDEIKKLSEEIVAAQQKEIATMKQWQQQWGYTGDTQDLHTGH